MDAHRSLGRRLRRPLHLAGVLALLIVLFGAGSALATVTKTNTYDVEGCQLSEVWEDIQEKGPVDAGSVYAGEAETVLGASFTPSIDCDEVPMSECEPEGVGFECKAKLTVKYELKTTVLLPNWPGAADACDEAKAEWARFIEKLTEHEHGHDAAVQKALDGAEPKTMFMSEPFRDCDAATARAQAQAAEAGLMEAMNDELERLEGIIKQANIDYDAETKHGATQGATLDTSIVCEKEKSPKEQLEEIASDLDFVDPEGLRNALKKKLEAALVSIEKGNAEAAKKQIEAFVKQVEAQRGKKLDAEVADDLIARAKAAAEGL